MIVKLKYGDRNNPEDNQLFNIAPIDDNTNTNTPLRYYSGSYEYSESETGTSKETNIHNTVSEYKDFKLLCGANEYMSGLKLIRYDAGDKIQYTCKDINNQNSDITKARSEFFARTVKNKFEHSHKFSADILHKDKVIDSESGTSMVDELNMYTSNIMNEDIEIFITNEEVFLNESENYSPLQKIYIYLGMLKKHNIKDVNLDEDTLYSYYNKQIDSQTKYNELLDPTTTSNTTTSNTTTSNTTTSNTTTSNTTTSNTTTSNTTTSNTTLQ